MHSKPYKMPTSLSLAYHGRLALLQELLKDRPKALNEQDAVGQTPLISACKSGQVDVVEMLLSFHIESNPSLFCAIDLPAIHGYTAFLSICRKLGPEELQIETRLYNKYHTSNPEEQKSSKQLSDDYLLILNILLKNGTDPYTLEQHPEKDNHHTGVFYLAQSLKNIVNKPKHTITDLDNLCANQIIGAFNIIFRYYPKFIIDKKILPEWNKTDKVIERAREIAIAAFHPELIEPAPEKEIINRRIPGSELAPAQRQSAAAVPSIVVEYVQPSVPAKIKTASVRSARRAAAALTATGKITPSINIFDLLPTSPERDDTGTSVSPTRKQRKERRVAHHGEQLSIPKRAQNESWVSRMTSCPTPENLCVII